MVVPAPGHTPGSVIIFVTLYDGTRYAFVGDLVWQLEGITLREERPWITRRSADLDAGGTRENLLRIVALKKRLPELIIVPAHEAVKSSSVTAAYPRDTEEVDGSSPPRTLPFFLARILIGPGTPLCNQTSGS